MTDSQPMPDPGDKEPAEGSRETVDEQVDDQERDESEHDPSPSAGGP